MATPLVAAVYALVGQVRGTFDPTILGNLLTSTANANLWNDGSTTYGVLAPVPQQGPGLVQAYDAAFATTLLSTQSISFNDSAHFVPNATFSIENTGSESVSYTIGHAAALTVYTFDEDGDDYPAFFPNPTADAVATLAFSETTVELAAGSTAEITVSPTPPAGLDETLLPVYSGYITINGTSGESLTIPYLGVVGSMYDQVVIDPVYDFLTNYSSDGSPVAANTTFVVPYPTLAEAESPSADIGYPAVLVQLDVGTAVIRVDVVPLDSSYTNTTEVLGSEIAGSVYGFPATYQPRLYFFSAFTGLLADGTIVPEGQYQLVAKALRIFGDPSDVNDYDVVELVPFTLLYE